MIKTQVMNVYRKHVTSINITSLRLGRIYAEEQKGKLEGLTDDEILWLLDPANPEQIAPDKFVMGQIEADKEKPYASIEQLLRDSVPAEERKSD